MSAGTIAAAVAELLGRPVGATAPLAGGDIAAAHRVEVDRLGPVFVKTRPPDASWPTGMLAAEADGLARLAATGTVRVPEVLAVRDGEPDREPVLILSWVEPGHPGPDHDRELGRSLAALHGAPCAGFGLTTAAGRPAPNWIGPLPQDNAPADTWATFYGTRRLAPLVRRAVDDGRLPTAAATSVDRLIGRLPDLVGPVEPPALLHGDLWAGNALVAADGGPVLVDPAVYGGHREVDLAMMRLFGGFGPRVFAAYAEARPLAAGHGDRVALYQLYPLLVHVVLFGGGFAARALAALDRYR